MRRVHGVDRILALQCGVISRTQAFEAGLTAHELRRLLRRRTWVRLHAGVYVDHTGEPTWIQRAWGAVLFAWPAALSHDSALRAASGPVVGRNRCSSMWPSPATAGSPDHPAYASTA